MEFLAPLFDVAAKGKYVAMFTDYLISRGSKYPCVGQECYTRQKLGRSVGCSERVSQEQSIQKASGVRDALGVITTMLA